MFIFRNEMFTYELCLFRNKREVLRNRFNCSSYSKKQISLHVEVDSIIINHWQYKCKFRFSLNFVFVLNIERLKTRLNFPFDFIIENFVYIRLGDVVVIVIQQYATC